MSLKKYKQADLIMLTVIAIVCEIIAYWASTKLPGAGFYLSFSILLGMIAILRWGLWGAIVYPIAGLVLVFTAQAGEIIEKILLYPVANSFIVISVLIFKYIKRDRVKDSFMKTVLFVIISYGAVAVGKGLAMLILVGQPINGIIIYLTAELFNIIIVTLLMLFLRKREGLMSDMNTYFEEEEENCAV